MEAASGAVLFVSAFTGTVTAGPGTFDVESVWAAIKAIAVPAKGVMPRLPALPSEPSQEARKVKSGGLTNKMVGAGIVAAAVCLCVAYPAAALLWVAGLIYGLFHFNKIALDAGPWLRRYEETDARWDGALDQWRSELGIGPLQTLRAELERAVDEYKGLGSAKAQALGRLQTDRHNRQLHDYLDGFLIQRASIPGIGPAKTVTLASFGIESAADINRSAITSIPGFGPATADKLLAWRSKHERQFVYNPAPLPADKHAQAKVEAEFAAKASALAKRISSGQLEMAQIANTLRQRLHVEDGSLGEIAVRRAQLGADLQFLGISRPVKPAPVKPVPSCPRPATQSAPGRVVCPRCGATMVRRMARRGRRSGRMFWGCSRYPTCRGTRN